MREVSAATAMAVDYTLMSVTFAFLALRLYVRVRILRKFDATDILVCLSWCIFASLCASDVLSDKWGLWNPNIKFTQSGGLPDFEQFIPDRETLRRALIMIWAIQPLYLLEMYSIKLSFLLLYMQIFPPAMPRLRISLYLSFGLVALSFLSATCLDLFYCLPVSRNWTSNRADRCMTTAAVVPYLYISATNILTDLVVYALPFFLLPTLYRSTSSTVGRKRRLAALAAIMSLGLLSIICTVGRLLFTSTGTNAASVCLWNSAEQATAITVACCPPLRYLFSRRRVHCPCSEENRREREERQVTKTEWRFWRMNGFTTRDIETTAGSYNITVHTTRAECDRETVFTGTGLAPRRPSQNTGYMPKKQVSDVANDEVSKVSTKESDGDSTTANQGVEIDEVSNNHDRRGPNIWYKGSRGEKGVESVVRRARPGSDTFGGSQITDQRVNDADRTSADVVGTAPKSTTSI